MTTPITKGSMERRIFPATELRVATDGTKKKLSGYSAVFNRDSVVLGGWFRFIERILPGAFSETLRTADVRCLFNHDANMVLGRSQARTLRLVEDDKGLLMECDPPATSVGADVTALVERGDISGQSFSFVTIEDRWTFYKDDRPAFRELIKVELYDVGPVTFPAYPDTDVAARSSREDCEQVYRRAMERYGFGLDNLRLAELELEEADLEG